MAPREEPHLVQLDPDARETIARLFEQGYLPIGSASFMGPHFSPADAIQQAKIVGAAIIAVSSQYQDTVSRKVPLTLPNNATTYNTGMANAFATGSAGPGRYIGRPGSLGTQTTYITVSEDRYDQRAIFFASVVGLGSRLSLGEITTQQPQHIGTNRAVQVFAAIPGLSAGARNDDE
jgi:hypothetical protein